jgi:Flp pilus assembly protein TadG
MPENKARMQDQSNQRPTFSARMVSARMVAEWPRFLHRTFSHQEEGASVVLFVIVITVLLGFAGVALDGSNIYFQNQQMQIAADAAALGGARMLSQHAGFDEVDAEVHQLAYANDADSVTWATINNSRAVSVNVSRTFPAYFARIYGYASFTVKANADAQYEPVAAVDGLFPFTLDCDCATQGGVSVVPNGDDTATPAPSNPPDVLVPTATPTSTPTNTPTPTPTATSTTVPASSGTVVLADGSSYSISFISQTNNTWTYKVSENSGKDLSHWLLAIDTCLNKIVTFSPAGAGIGSDGSTGISGIKWDLTDKFKSGNFSFTLNAAYPAGEVSAFAKSSTGSNSIKISGPICVSPTPTPTPTFTATPAFTPAPTPAHTATPTPTGELNACTFQWVDWDGNVSSQNELAQNMDNVARSGIWHLNEVIPHGPQVIYYSAVAAELDGLKDSGDAVKIPLSHKNGDGNFVICGFSNIKLRDYDLDAGTLTVEILNTLIHGVETDASATDTGVGHDVRLIR